MITYETGKYGIMFAFTCTGSVFPRSCLWAVPAAVVAFLVNQFLVFEDMRDSKALTMMGSFSFILGFLIVFKCQQSFSRWWEGGTLLKQVRGDWFNAYSCLLAFTNPDPAKHAQVRHFQERLIRLMSLLYSCALDSVSTGRHFQFPIIDQTGMNLKSFEFLVESNDKCEITMQWLQKLVVQVESDGTLKIAPPILSRVFQQLGDGIVNLNNARKITEFPIPFPLAQMVTVMLLIHWCATTYFCAVNLNSPFEAALVAFVNVFVVWCINYIAGEMEHPFGDDRNDLPIEEMQADFNASLAQLLNEAALVPPSYESDKPILEIHETETRSTFDGLAHFLRVAVAIASEPMKQDSVLTIIETAPSGRTIFENTASMLGPSAGRVSMIDEVVPDPKYNIEEGHRHSDDFKDGRDPKDSTCDGVSVPLKGNIYGQPVATGAPKAKASQRNAKTPGAHAQPGPSENQSHASELKSRGSHRVPKTPSVHNLSQSSDLAGTAHHRVDTRTE